MAVQPPPTAVFRRANAATSETEVEEAPRQECASPAQPCCVEGGGESSKELGCALQVILSRVLSPVANMALVDSRGVATARLREHSQDERQLGVDNNLLRPNASPSRRQKRKTGEQFWTGWLSSMSTYAPDLEYGDDIVYALTDFDAALLSDETAVTCLKANKSGSSLLDGVLDEKALQRALEAKDDSHFEFYYMNRFLFKSSETTIPPDPRKLRASPASFKMLLSHLEVAPAFVAAVSRFYQPASRGIRHQQLASMSKSFDIWYMLPVRVQVDCTTDQLDHAKSTAGSSQMDPFHYLHLPDEKVDIRGSHIAVYCKINTETRKSTTFCISFQDGRWSRTVEEPMRRVREVLKKCDPLGGADDPFSIHLVYLTSALRWWSNALDSLNSQLIAHEKSLQRQIENLDHLEPDFNNDMNKALHAMTAHVHRFRSELVMVEEIITDIAQHRETFFNLIKQEPSERVTLGLFQIGSHFSAVSNLRQEVENKITNILALLFNNIQVSNDRMLVANGKAMHDLLESSRNEATQSLRLAEASQRLAVAMRKDSVAMKTIAVLTVFFLPGTSFAAFFAMPFFTKSSWMTKTTQVWVWVAITVPSTLLAFLFFVMWTSREQRAKQSTAQVEMGLGLSSQGDEKEE